MLILAGIIGIWLYVIAAMLFPPPSNVIEVPRAITVESVRIVTVIIERAVFVEITAVAATPTPTATPRATNTQVVKLTDTPIPPALITAIVPIDTPIPTAPITATAPMVLPETGSE